jgi:nucleotide-binding universal stress UspA family protein
MLKDIVVNLTGGGPQDFAVNYAVSVAREFGAQLTGIAFVFDPVIPDAGLGGVSPSLIEMQRDENTKTAQDAVNRFMAAAKSAGLSAETRSIDASLAGATGEFGRMARRFDISVVGQGQRDYGATEDLMIEGALFESGRPVIVVPYIQTQGLSLERVMVCWDGGRTAARAIADALPLLMRAKAVEVVVVTEPRKSSEVDDTHMAEHLTRHGVPAVVKRITRGDIDVQSAILSHAADFSADFIVMGGYGHSRLREFIWGGVTRNMLGAMTVPVLMSH